MYLRRFVTAEDLKAYSIALYEGQLHLRSEYLWKIEALTETQIKEYTEGSDLHCVHILVCEEGSNGESEQLIGVVLYDPTINRLRQFIVDPTVRGKGLGMLLVRATAKESAALGHEKLLVTGWTGSLGFYEKADFTLISENPKALEGRHPCFYLHRANLSTDNDVEYRL